LAHESACGKLGADLCQRTIILFLSAQYHERIVFHRDRQWIVAIAQRCPWKGTPGSKKNRGWQAKQWGGGCSNVAVRWWQRFYRYSNQVTRTRCTAAFKSQIDLQPRLTQSKTDSLYFDPGNGCTGRAWRTRKVNENSKRNRVSYSTAEYWRGNHTRENQLSMGTSRPRWKSQLKLCTVVVVWRKTWLIKHFHYEMKLRGPTTDTSS